MVPINDVAIIGGGPSAIATARFLLGENQSTKITIYEQRSAPGIGTWDHTPTVRDGSFAFAPTKPHMLLGKPRWSGTTPIFPTPLYDHLETNIPHNYMGFKSIPFPPAIPLLPNHTTIAAYLTEASRPYERLFRRETQVISLVPPSPSNPATRWQLTSLHLPSAVETTTSYDAVAICTGHYDVPHVPPFSGIETWMSAYPGAVTHSKGYRNPEHFAGQKVLVVGTSASGVDISAAIASVTPHRVLVSRHTGEVREPTATKVEVPSIDTFLPPSVEHPRAIRFSNGHIETDIDAVVFCTGYLYAFPFLPTYLQERLVGDGSCVEELYQHLFWRHDSSLVFIGLLRRVLPLPIAEAQAAVVARVWSGRLGLPAFADMVDWEQKRTKDCETRRAFHLFRDGEDLLYCEGLGRWCAQAKGEDQDHGLQARQWTAKDYWLRRMIPTIKMMWMSKGSERFDLRTVEDLGLSFEETTPTRPGKKVDEEESSPEKAGMADGRERKAEALKAIDVKS